ncbi:hypothetical protein ECTPHS_05956 [Ectothiorhodospira sp. PHS-1]|nr:hypothetical protein ECTPHS_05956 [Ectothiorhodospira sp. PHS-1]
MTGIGVVELLVRRREPVAVTEPVARVAAAADVDVYGLPAKRVATLDHARHVLGKEFLYAGHKLQEVDCLSPEIPHKGSYKHRLWRRWPSLEHRLELTEKRCRPEVGFLGYVVLVFQAVVLEPVGQDHSV